MKPSILYSFRRCPYAIRTRMTLAYAQANIELREILLKNKPEEMLLASPKGTVPVLIAPDGKVLEESLEIIYWALQQSDPEHWYHGTENKFKEFTNTLIHENDNVFKKHLDRYKYASRYPERSEADYRADGEVFLSKLNHLLQQQAFLLGDRFSLADIAIFPFIRQFAFVNIKWFKQSPYSHLRNWLDYFLTHPLFNLVMHKYPQWQANDKPQYLPTFDQKNENR
ncbi:glutathione S-transferase [Aliikangiella sp. IMCC44653]